MRHLHVISFAALAVLCVNGAHASDGLRWNEGIGFYVGVDGLSTLSSGSFTGLANPNAGRLTFLFDHGNHFHGIGAYSYTGTAAAPVVANTNANNRIPELSARQDATTSAIPLQAGTGELAGHWASGPLPATVDGFEYSHLGMASIHSLAGLGAAADILYSSSGARWNTVADDVVVGLKLESISAGLKVALDGQLDVFGAGDVVTLGSLASLGAWPVLYADGSAAAGIYTARFSLVNLGSNTAVGNSGSFFVDVSVPAVPEPATWGLVLAGLAMAGLMASRRCLAAPAPETRPHGR